MKHTLKGEMLILKFRTSLITSPMTDPVWFFKRPGPVRIGNKITPVYGTFFASE